MSFRLRITARLWGSVRHYSRQTKQPSRKTQKFSLAVTGKPPKSLIIDQLREHVKSLASQRFPNHAAVILATRDFATWLDDEKFMSSFLKTLFSASDHEATFSVDVLAGVMDGLSPERRFGEPRRGFSILYGGETLLPKLWETEATVSNGNSHRDIAASISFDINPSHEQVYDTVITVPLANTIFQNGRRSTLFATQWELGSGGDQRPTMMQDKWHQRVAVANNGALAGETVLPLLPLAPPRKIVSGLGNIVRQVEIEGIASPASQELEKIIPQLLEKRSQRNPEVSIGPIGVWAWVIPPDIVDTGSNLLSKLRFFQDNQDETESALNDQSVVAFDTFLGQGRCRLHKILSGGGGWGAKQGLLSLDPETSYSAPEQDDIDDFMRAFQERGNENQLDGLVKPGSYILYCVEVIQRGEDLLSDSLLTPGFVLSVADGNEEDVLLPDGSIDLVEVIPNHFGVMSATGLYRVLNRSSLINPEEYRGTMPLSMKTKIDVPKAALWFHSS